MSNNTNADAVAALIDATDKKTLAIWAADCAAHVLPVFTQENPDDMRPRKAVDAARAWARGEMSVGEARKAAFAAHAAARGSADSRACFAARAAGHAAATAHTAGHAVHSAAYAAKAAGADAEAEREWQYRRLAEMGET